VTAASQVSPFREHGIHYIQANIVYRVDVDRCDLFGTLLDLSSWAKPCICTAPGHAMFALQTTKVGTAAMVCANSQAADGFRTTSTLDINK
jgi:hypothetical protein